MNKFLLLLLIPLCSCATVFGHMNSSIALDSSPDGAKVEVLDRKGQTAFVGVTPTTASLPNGDGYFTKARYTVKMSKEGFEPSVTQMSPGLNGWYFGNVIFGGLIGFLIVDPISGSMFEFDPSSVHVRLAAAPDSSIAAAGPASSEPPSGDDASTTAKLKEIKKLRDEGVLNQSEYDSKKKELMDRL
jgi:hypothetical protein